MDKYDIDLTGVTWVTSSSSNGSGNCVEVAGLTEGYVGVRDSKRPDGGVQIYTPAEWTAFVEGVKNGEFDAPGKS